MQLLLLKKPNESYNARASNTYLLPFKEWLMLQMKGAWNNEEKTKKISIEREEGI